ncbi:MAG: alginate export family protein [Pseudomonadota bacterium]
MTTRHTITLALRIAVASTVLSVLAPATADVSLADAIRAGKVYANFNLRSESVDQDNALEDASALTLRTRLGYQTGQYRGFSGLLEVEDSRIVAGQNEFTVGPTGFNPGVYSVIADPETTELDQALIQYTGNNFVAKLGRQVIAFDNHRFIGHVGWRQDRQTFDGFRLNYTGFQGVTASYAYVGQRNRIFAEDGDIDSEDHFLNVGYASPIGKVVGYAYLLEVDNNVSNGLDTVGAFLEGAREIGETNKLLYHLQVASQEADNGGATFDTTYLRAEAGVGFKPVTVKLGYERLGSDDGNFGFSTPLSTLHAHNGWSDQFLATPAQGLVDVALTLTGGLAGGKWLAVYHDFEADEATETIDDLGSELNLQYTRTFAEKYNIGLKFATYDAGDPAAGKVDKNIFWAWFNTGF